MYFAVTTHRCTLAKDVFVVAAGKRQPAILVSVVKRAAACKVSPVLMNDSIATNFILDVVVRVATRTFGCTRARGIVKSVRFVVIGATPEKG